MFGEKQSKKENIQHKEKKSTIANLYKNCTYLIKIEAFKLPNIPSKQTYVTVGKAVSLCNCLYKLHLLVLYAAFLTSFHHLYITRHFII